MRLFEKCDKCDIFDCHTLTTAKQTVALRSSGAKSELRDWRLGGAVTSVTFRFVTLRGIARQAKTAKIGRYERGCVKRL